MSYPEVFDEEPNEAYARTIHEQQRRMKERKDS
jgi:hypothetical protein